MSGAITDWLDRHDPERSAVFRSVKAAVVVTVGLAIGTLIGNSELNLFVCFGGIAMLLFADFPGTRSGRLGAYLGLALVGGVLIALGTLASQQIWLAVGGMAVAGFVVLFGGVVSAAAAGAGRAALLAFVLPVTVPGTTADIGPRLAGWVLAAALAIPAAVYVFPPTDHDRLRTAASRACEALAAELHELLHPGDPTALADVRTATDAALADYRKAFRSTTFRPVALSTGSRLLMQLTDRLEWLRSVLGGISADEAKHWPERPRELVELCSLILQTGGRLVDAAPADPQLRRRLDDALAQAKDVRATATTFLLVMAEPQTAGPAFDAARLHELFYTTRLAGQTLSRAAAADARPLVDRLLGRNGTPDLPSPVTAAERIMAGHSTRRSVWFQNSVRGAAGLAISVLLAEVTGLAHGFWVVLGTMSILRTTALNTGATALRAMVGTVIGFGVGSVLILLFGVTPWHLWVLLPILLLVSGFVPTAVSFIAGQAAFTGLVVILFNIIKPTGWTVGLVRIEDVALGCVAGLVSGVLLWPRGASGQIRAALANLFQAAGASLRAATHQVSAGVQPDSEEMRQAVTRALHSSIRLDDAVREYLAERGTRSLPLDAVTTLSDGANRIRLAAETIADMPRVPERSTVAPAAPSDETDGVQARAVDEARQSLAAAATTVQEWINRLADVLAPDVRRAELPVSRAVDAEHQVLQALRRAPWQPGREWLQPAETVWAASLYVDDIAGLEPRIASRTAMLN